MRSGDSALSLAPKSTLELQLFSIFNFFFCSWTLPIFSINYSDRDVKNEMINRFAGWFFFFFFNISFNIFCEFRRVESIAMRSESLVSIFFDVIIKCHYWVTFFFDYRFQLQSDSTLRTETRFISVVEWKVDQLSSWIVAFCWCSIWSAWCSFIDSIRLEIELGYINMLTVKAAIIKLEFPLC